MEETGLPEPCNGCEHARLQDVYFDGRMISWCAYGHDSFWGDENCPFFEEIYKRPQHDDD
jgi:hypothetical protein